MINYEEKLTNEMARDVRYWGWTVNGIVCAYDHRMTTIDLLFATFPPVHHTDSCKKKGDLLFI